jgi:hypothetical protein
MSAVNFSVADELREEPRLVESAAELLDEVAFLVADRWHISGLAAKPITADEKHFDKARSLGPISLPG